MRKICHLYEQRVYLISVTRKQDDNRTVVVFGLVYDPLEIKTRLQHALHYKHVCKTEEC